jgi:hypothetical protein
MNILCKVWNYGCYSEFDLMSVRGNELKPVRGADVERGMAACRTQLGPQNGQCVPGVNHELPAPTRR